MTTTKDKVSLENDLGTTVGALWIGRLPLDVAPEIGEPGQKVMVTTTEGLLRVTELTDGVIDKMAEALAVLRASPGVTKGGAS